MLSLNLGLLHFTQKKWENCILSFLYPPWKMRVAQGKQMKTHKHWGTSHQLPLTFQNAKYPLQTPAQSKLEHRSRWISAEPWELMLPTSRFPSRLSERSTPHSCQFPAWDLPFLWSESRSKGLNLIYPDVPLTRETSAAWEQNALSSWLLLSFLVPNGGLRVSTYTNSLTSLHILEVPMPSFGSG